MKKNEREKMILAMEYIARQVNNEDIFNLWLSEGVADGDIPYGSIDPSDVDLCYTEDDTFKELMSIFLELMNEAWKDGGLYCDKIVSRDKNYKE